MEDSVRKSLAFVIIATSLLACSYRPEIVQVPVPVPCPPPPALERPELPIGALKPESPADQVMKAYVASIEVLKGYAIQLEKLLGGYRGKRDGQ